MSKTFVKQMTIELTYKERIVPADPDSHYRILKTINPHSLLWRPGYTLDESTVEKCMENENVRVILV